MYETERDPYCYSGIATLRNKAGITDSEALERFETAMTFARSEEPLPAGRLSVRHYCRVHLHLFQDVYTWAGRFRTVRLSKGSSAFCYPEHIAREMQRVFGWLQGKHFLRDRERLAFARAAAHFLAELNAIHPFREGNGRTQLTFMALLAEQAGHTLDFDRLDPEIMLDAMIKSFNANEEPLAHVITDLIAP